MNLFFLHINPEICAQQHCDKHVVKMLLEIVQMLYTAHYLLKSELPDFAYRKISTPTHPTAIWIRSNLENYSYASKLALCLSEEYTHRYNRIHSCDKHIKYLINHLPVFKEINDPYGSCKKKVVFGKTNEFVVPLSMPDECKTESVVTSYRNYYNLYKKSFAKWTNRNPPPWFTNINIRIFFKKK